MWNVPDDADYVIDAYKNGKVLISTWHRGEASRDMEISVFEARMSRNEIDYILVVDRNAPSKSYRLTGTIRSNL